MEERSRTYRESASPGWFDQIRSAKADKGRTVFLLHFNIYDVVFDQRFPPDHPDDLLTVTEFLGEAIGTRNVVLTYSLHNGIEMVKPQGQRDLPKLLHASSADPESLWQEMASRADADPYPLNQPRAQLDPAPPERARVPGRVGQLLHRALTDPYSLSGPADQRDAGPQPLSVGLIVNYLHHLVPAPGANAFAQHSVSELVETLQHWSVARELRDHNHIVVLLTPELAAIHPELRGTDSRIEAVRIPRPDREERASFLRWLATFDEWAGIRDAALLEAVANRSSGMNYDELRELARAIKPDRNWELLIKSRRDEIIQRESGGLLVAKESRFGLADIAGYAYVREYLDRILARLRQGRADITGVLFAGPPGTGKSFYAGALARDAGVNVVVMRSLRGMYVGQSERNLEQVLEVARSLAPVIIFVDEVDQAFGNRRQQSTDGGVDQRLLGRLLEFMDDKENLGKVIWVAASNRPDLLDEALLSRFRIRVPFLLPDLATCCELLREKLPRQAGFAWQPHTWTQQREHALASEVAGRFSVRELETIVSVARWHAEDQIATGKAAPQSSPDGPLFDAKHLATAIEKAEVGHNENEYLRQSLLAIKYVPYKVEQLVKALESALPAEASQHILRNGSIDSVQLNLLLERIPRPSAAQ